MRIVMFTAAAAIWAAGLALSLAEEGRDETVAVIADLSESNLSAEEIQGITSLPAVRVVSLGSFSGADLQQLEEAMRETEDNFGEVRAAVERNETLEAALRERRVPLSRVVAVTQADENGTITVYTSKPSP